MELRLPNARGAAPVEMDLPLHGHSTRYWLCDRGWLDHLGRLYDLRPNQSERLQAKVAYELALLHTWLSLRCGAAYRHRRDRDQPS